MTIRIATPIPSSLVAVWTFSSGGSVHLTGAKTGLSFAEVGVTFVGEMIACRASAEAFLANAETGVTLAAEEAV